jgi:hypothetical protein
MHLDNFLRKGSVRSYEQIINVSINNCKNSRGRDGRYHKPVSARVVNTVERLKIFPRAVAREYCCDTRQAESRAPSTGLPLVFPICLNPHALPKSINTDISGLHPSWRGEAWQRVSVYRIFRVRAMKSMKAWVCSTRSLFKLR